MTHFDPTNIVRIDSELAETRYTVAAAQAIDRAITLARAHPNREFACKLTRDDQIEAILPVHPNLSSEQAIGLQNRIITGDVILAAIQLYETGDAPISPDTFGTLFKKALRDVGTSLSERYVILQSELADKEDNSSIIELLREMHGVALQRMAAYHQSTLPLPSPTSGIRHMPHTRSHHSRHSRGPSS